MIADPVALQNLAIVRAQDVTAKASCACVKVGGSYDDPDVDSGLCPRHGDAHPEVRRCASCDWRVLRDDCDVDGDCLGCQVRFAAEKEAA